MATSRSLAACADYVISSIEARGITLEPTSRLCKMRNVLFAPDGKPKVVPSDSADFDISLEANRDFQQLAFVFDQLSATIPPREFDTKLKALVHDDPLPQDDSDGSSTGRDAQCELYVAAICAKAGLDPIIAEPDILCTLNHVKWAVSIKRIKSKRQFGKRMRKAVEQAQRVDLPSIVVADVSIMVNQENVRIYKPISDEEFRRIVQIAQTRFLADYRARLLEWFKGTQSRGVLFIDHHLRQHPMHGWTLASPHFTFNLSMYNQRRGREFDAFVA